MAFSAWESFLEKHIEGFFNKKFSSSLEPAELRRKLLKEAVRQKREEDGKIYVPNSFWLGMQEEDYHRLKSSRVIKDLEILLMKQVILEDAFMRGELQINFVKEPEATEGMLLLDVAFAEPPEEADGRAARDDGAHTIVLKRPAFDVPLNLPEDVPLAALTVIEGTDLDACFTLGEKKMFIGRREQSDFILTDPNTSRLHASISYQEHRHILCDEASTNGLFVHGNRIRQATLSHGDEIQLGATVLLYEVIQ
ncbi:hypothetical protein TAMA11512_08250 [Selenomonas sp. TAMA-11512]|uniref:FhaA domain-containing protein n=1 Tax=Selenomonas sp. TAMA-11512 TaxID=3095337 RepID=UPI00308995FF|nr:hypothetical protein TAMA11512_08250 [Selenomonas sp. TAMA-11512]